MTLEKPWEELLGIPWPTATGKDSLCDQSGECCRSAAQSAPWKTTLYSAMLEDETARNFLNQFIPYASHADAEAAAKSGVDANLALARERGDNLDDIVFYHCRFLEGKNKCLIYEDRPSLCRDFPESPFGAIASCCGYAPLAKTCNEKIDAMKAELAELRKLKPKDPGGLKF